VGRRLARALLHAHLPAGALARPLYAALYRAHVAVREGFAWGVRFFWYEPLFRSQCESVGSGFRMERLPYLAGSGRIAIGDNVRLSGKIGIGFARRSGGSASLTIGDGTFVGHDCGLNIAESISIGRRCLLATRVSVRDYHGHAVEASARGEVPDEPAPVVIGDDVWIGAGATILKGIRIGDRAVIGAGAIVTRDVPADCVAAGNPARVVRLVTGRRAA
jgi:acetyltransferase-like isoleucine patch superfamily enzyme